MRWTWKYCVLVNERAAAAHAIGKLKSDGIAYRPEREAQILRRLSEVNPGPLANPAVTRLFTEIVSACRGLEDVFVGGQSWAERHLQRGSGGQTFWQRRRPRLLFASIDEVFRAVESGPQRLRRGANRKLHRRRGGPDA